MKKSNLLYYFQVGYGLVNLPLGLLGFATTIYYLMVNNIGWLKELFPRFEGFLFLGGVLGVPATVLIGWIYIRSEFNRASTRTHPFSTVLVPAQFPLFLAVARLSRAQGFEEDAAALEALVEDSRKKW